MITIKNREKLGSHISLGSFAYLLEGIEDTLGEDGAEVIYTRAGRLRGHALMKEAAEKYPERLADQEKGAAALVELLADDGMGLLIGITGDPTRLRAEIAESMESAISHEGRPARRAMFTAGLLAGLMEASMGTHMQIEVVQVASDGKPDIFEFVPLG